MKLSALEYHVTQEKGTEWAWERLIKLGPSSIIRHVANSSKSLSTMERPVGTSMKKEPVAINALFAPQSCLILKQRNRLNDFKRTSHISAYLLDH